MWCPSTWTAQEDASHHLRPGPVQVMPPFVSQFIPEEGSRRSQAALWEGNAMPGPVSVWETCWHHLGTARTRGCLGAAGWGWVLSPAVGDFRLQGSPVPLTALMTWLRGDGLEGVGGDTSAPLLAESRSYPSGYH